MPRLSDVMAGADATWGEQVDKGSLAGMPFWIHGVKSSDYENDSGEDVHILVLDITLNGPSRRDVHAVITVGNTPERAPMLAYFNTPDGDRQPIGPVHCFEIPLKNKRSFWRIEDYDVDIMDALIEHGRYDADGQKVLPGA